MPCLLQLETLLLPHDISRTKHFGRMGRDSHPSTPPQAVNAKMGLWLARNEGMDPYGSPFITQNYNGFPTRGQKIGVEVRSLESLRLLEHDTMPSCC